MSGLSTVHTLVEFTPRQEPPHDPPPSRALVLYDTPLELIEPSPAARQLGAIIDRYQHTPDTLSNTVVWYGRELMHFVQEVQPSREAFIANFIGLKQILSLGSNMPNDPWIIGDLVGERPALDLYCKVVSILSGQHISLREHGRPHEFAREVIAWVKQMEGFNQELQPINTSRTELVPAYSVVINDLGVPVLDRFPVELEEPITSWSIDVDENSISTEEALAIYNKFELIMLEQREARQEEIDRQLAINEKIEIIERIKKDNVISAQELAENKAKQQQNLVEYERRAEQHTQDVITSFNQLRTDYQSSETRLENKASGLEKTLTEEQNKLAEAIKKINEQQVTINGLVNNNGQLWGQVQRLESRVDRRPSLCIIS